jgi:hypothetical protein
MISRMRRDEQVGATRESLLAAAERLFAEHLESLGSPTWYARFAAQVMADPALNAIMVDEALMAAPIVRSFRDGLTRCLPGLPAEIHHERGAMARYLVLQTCVERERALAEHAPTFRPTWDDTAGGLIDVIVALWRAPVLEPG